MDVGIKLGDQGNSWFHAPPGAGLVGKAWPASELFEGGVGEEKGLLTA